MLVNFTNRLNITCVPQWQMNQKKWGDVSASSPCPCSFRVWRWAVYFLMCLFSCSFITWGCFVSALKLKKKTLWKKQVKKIFPLDSGERYWTGDWHYRAMALPLSAPSSFLVFRWWQIQRDNTAQTSMVFQCCCDPIFKPISSPCFCRCAPALSSFFCCCAHWTVTFMLSRASFSLTWVHQSNKMKPFIFTFRFP